MKLTDKSKSIAQKCGTILHTYSVPNGAVEDIIEGLKSYNDSSYWRDRERHIAFPKLEETKNTPTLEKTPPPIQDVNNIDRIIKALQEYNEYIKMMYEQGKWAVVKDMPAAKCILQEGEQRGTPFHGIFL